MADTLGAIAGSLLTGFVLLPSLGTWRSLMLRDCAYLITSVLGMMRSKAGQRTRLDWQGDRGLSFLQLGLRELARLCYEPLPLPILQSLPKCNHRP